MAPRSKSRFWRRCRIVLRRARLFVLFVTLTLLCGFIYVNQIGLPGFIKKPLQDRLRLRGIEAQFTRIRWRLYRGIVAENVEFGAVNRPTGPRFSAKQAQVQLNYRALLKLQLRINALVLQEGELAWRFSSTNAPEHELAMNRIQTELRLLPGDLWE